VLILSNVLLPYCNWNTNIPIIRQSIPVYFTTVKSTYGNVISNRGKASSMTWQKNTHISWWWVGVGMIQLELYCHLDVVKINGLLVCVWWTQLCIFQNISQVTCTVCNKTAFPITVVSPFKQHTSCRHNNYQTQTEPTAVFIVRPFCLYYLQS